LKNLFPFSLLIAGSSIPEKWVGKAKSVLLFRHESGKMDRSAEKLATIQKYWLEGLKSISLELYHKARHQEFALKNQAL
jgi:hypothetical protein